MRHDLGPLGAEPVALYLHLARPGHETLPAPLVLGLDRRQLLPLRGDGRERLVELPLAPLHGTQTPRQLRLGRHLVRQRENGHAASFLEFDLCRRPITSIGRRRAPVNPEKGGQGRACRRESGRALEPLFDPRAGNDLVPVAEAHPGAQGAVLVPKPVELRVEAVDVSHDGRVVLSGELLVQANALRAEAIDLLVYLLERSHDL